MHISNSQLRFECIHCHYEGLGGGLPKTPCLDCHKNSDSSTYEDLNTIEMPTHSSAVMESDQYGEWTRECLDCHDPHKHNGMNIYDGITDGSYVIANFIAHDAVTDPVTLTTTFTMTDVNIHDPDWSDLATWGQKTSDKRGLLFVWHNPLLDKHYWIEVISATEGTITINAPSFPRIPRVNPDPIPVQLVYGMLIQDEIGPFPIVYSGPKSMANDESGTGFDPTPTGICQVCHTKTLHWRNTGALADHFSGQKCTMCHPHEEGFKWVSPTPHLSPCE